MGLPHLCSQSRYSRTAIRHPALTLAGEDSAKGGADLLPPSQAGTAHAVSLTQGKGPLGKNVFGLPGDPKCLLPKTCFCFPFRKQSVVEAGGCGQQSLLV